VLQAPATAAGIHIKIMRKCRLAVPQVFPSAIHIPKPIRDSFTIEVPDPGNRITPDVTQRDLLLTNLKTLIEASSQKCGEPGSKSSVGLQQREQYQPSPKLFPLMMKLSTMVAPVGHNNCKHLSRLKDGGDIE
jgi:hypothetical protein